mmetsp:Transcript_4743/g.16354  ORF Transcript_4743/g.16354 Transcript_4743/m.16354 type:complete len:230 (+) Transcript_4743:1081-1770(+)
MPSCVSLAGGHSAGLPASASGTNASNSPTSARPCSWANSRMPVAAGSSRAEAQRADERSPGSSISFGHGCSFTGRCELLPRFLLGQPADPSSSRHHIHMLSMSTAGRCVIVARIAPNSRAIFFFAALADEVSRFTANSEMTRSASGIRYAFGQASTTPGLAAPRPSLNAACSACGYVAFKNCMNRLRKSECREVRTGSRVSSSCPSLCRRWCASPHGVDGSQPAPQHPP